MNILNRSTLKIKNGISYFEIPELAKLAWIRHAFLTRRGGVSLSPYSSLNLSDKNGDREEFVSMNKKILAETFGFDSSRLILLDQVHRDRILLLKKPIPPLPSPLEFDALITKSPNRFFGVLPADRLTI